jgi:hypothetical protein
MSAAVVEGQELTANRQRSCTSRGHMNLVAAHSDNRPGDSLQSVWYCFVDHVDTERSTRVIGFVHSYWPLLGREEPA